jgi:transcriptional repressor NrdR
MPNEAFIIDIHSRASAEKLLFCPFCNHKESRVLESRLTSENPSVRRRRQCEACRRRFTTYERVESIKLLVIKSSGTREPYSREKLLSGVASACAKTMVNADEVEALVDGVENELASSGKREVYSSTLGDMVLARLRDLNHVAYVRFASVYKQFQSIDDFIAELGALRKSR